MDVYPVNSGIEIIPETASYTTNPLFSSIKVCPECPVITVELLDNVVVLDGGVTPPKAVVILTIDESEASASPGRIVTKSHNLNVALVDVSVFDNNNNEIAVGVTILNPNEITLDLSRTTIPDGEVWSVLVEV